MNLINSTIKRILCIFILCLSTHCYSSQQKYEEMKDETKQMLSRAISDMAPEINSFSNFEEQKAWIEAQEQFLIKKIPSEFERHSLLKSIHYEATRAGLEPELILGLIEIESNFKKYAISSVSARGIMQVMPFWIDVIGENGHNLFHTRTNLRYGCVILKHYLDMENGNMFRALGRYNGSLGQSKYPDAVQNASQKYRKALNKIKNK